MGNRCVKFASEKYKGENLMLTWLVACLFALKNAIMKDLTLARVTLARELAKKGG